MTCEPRSCRSQHPQAGKRKEELRVWLEHHSAASRSCRLGSSSWTLFKQNDCWTGLDGDVNLQRGRIHTRPCCQRRQAQTDTGRSRRVWQRRRSWVGISGRSRQEEAGATERTYLLMLRLLRCSSLKTQTTSSTRKHFWFLNPNLFLQICWHTPRLPPTAVRAEVFTTRFFKRH